MPPRPMAPGAIVNAPGPDPEYLVSSIGAASTSAESGGITLGPTEPRGGFDSQSFCRTASISRVILILSPTTTPPPSRGMLNSIPKSARLISVPAENPARVPP